MSFFKEYLDYVGESESPDIYHRWTAISLIGSVLGRNFWFPHGHFTLYPNMYIMLQGLPAVRKSSAINIGNKILKKTGYKKFASSRMSREMFLQELHHINQPNEENYSFEELLDMKMDHASEITIHAGEFLDFIGQGDKDYLMLITNLWDNLDEYKNPKLTSKTVVVTKPTINFLAANTPESLNMAFPPEVIGSGTLSRFLFIHSPGTGKKILMPKAPDPEKEQRIVDYLSDIQDQVKGEATVTEGAIEVLDYLYNHQEPIDDPRFSHYTARRLTHLLKLSLIVAASRLSTEITERDVLEANTFLGAAEYGMPKALGHFGRSKYSASYHAILEFLEEARKPMTLKDLYVRFSSDFAKETDFLATMMDMQNADKVEAVREHDKFIGMKVKATPFPKWLKPVMLTEELTKQELSVIGLTHIGA